MSAVPLNEWLQLAPLAQPLCTVVAALVNISDFASRAPRWILEEDALDTGKYRFRLYSTHHLPHSWDAGMLFDGGKAIRSLASAMKEVLGKEE